MPREVTGKIQLTPPFFIGRMYGGTQEIMAIKLVLLKSGETIITDAKELVTPETEKVIGYIFNKPHKVSANKPVVFLAEGEDPNAKDRTVEITLSPWILLTSSEDIPVPTDHVVTVVDPIESVVEMYQEKTRGN